MMSSRNPITIYFYRIILLWSILATGSLADVRLPAILSDHMVVQAGGPVSIWGWADPAEEIAVSMAGRTVAVVAGTDGKWELKLPALEISATPQTLTVKGRNTVIVEDVLVGEVWLGSGQSNMQLPVSPVKSAAKEKAAARFPEIRMFTVGRCANTEEVDEVKGSWVVCAPETVGNFSATLYFFGRELHQRIQQPVGLIHSSWGGTPIQSWMPLESLKATPGISAFLERKKRLAAAWPEQEKIILADIRAWEDEAAKTKPLRPKPSNPGRPDSAHYMPSRLYNGMIHPLVRYQIRGLLWYQGEANARDGAAGATEYSDLQQRLIADWRRAWNQPELPFLFVQLPNYIDPRAETQSSWAFFREGQARTLSVPRTGMAVTIDIGEANDIHPKNKQDVGRRLAAIALADVYHFDGVSRAPEFLKQTIKGGEIHLSFRHAEGGLVMRGERIKGFKIAGAERAWHPAEARIEGGEIVVLSTAVPKPLEVRYGWADNPECNLYNRAGLPLTPFRTDAWD